MAVYVFVGIAFIIGLLCASVYHRLRGRGRGGRPVSAAALERLAATIHELDVRPADELGAVMLREIVAQLDCRAAAFYTRHDVELRLEAAHGLDAAQTAAIGRRLETNPELAEPLPRQARTLHLDRHDNTEAGDYALIAVTYERQTGVTVLSPPAAVADAYALSLVEAASGHVLGRLETIRLGEQLRQAATLDAVTRLHNQRYFLELLELEFNRSLRYRRSLALLLCGIDGFAELHDREGSEVADRTLRRIANAYRGSLRYFDVIGRYDLDTLAILLPEADVAAAVKVAERLLAGAAPTEPALSLSIGAAGVNGSGTDFLALVTAARGALQQARAAGGNCVLTSSD